MRLAPVAENPLERIALRANLAPLPAGFAMFGMPASRTVMVAQRVGLFARLVRGPASADELARALELQPAGTRLLCDVLASAGLLGRDGGRYTLAKRARPWLDPDSDRYIGGWLEHSATYWEWWGDLERVVREGRSFEIHREPADDEHYWRLYITGQYELARLSAGEVAKAIRLPDHATALLDVAGGHGWFSAQLCREHPGLAATVVDLPGSARVGREIIAAAGMSERVGFVEGDMFSVDLGGPYDGALCFDIIHHLDGERIVALLRRVHAALRPGATVAVLDMFRAEPGSQPTGSAAALGLFFHLTSGADLHSPGELADYLDEAGFDAPRRTRIRRIPDQDLYQARAR